MGSNLARGKIFTASIGSVDSLYPSVFIYCLNLHQFLILCSSKAMMFVKLYFRTSDIYLISLVSLLLANEIDTDNPTLCQASGGGGGMCTLIFYSYVGSDPASTVHPKKNIMNFKHPPKT